jgi:hypothetical protein
MPSFQPPPAMHASGNPARSVAGNPHHWIDTAPIHGDLAAIEGIDPD